jgi:KaiC/GvpD/RAD55 family RecA-like ATPase
MDIKLPERVKTGIDGLDAMLNGGFLKGRNILVSGPAGTGKSTLAIQFAYRGAVEYNEPSLYVTLEETRKKMAEDMSKFGFDLEAARKKGKFEIIGGPLAELKLGMHQSDASYEHLINEICEVVKEKKISRVVIDSINLFLMLTKNKEEQRTALAMLCNKLSNLGCTTILTSETKEGTMDLSAHGIEEFVVDGVVVLYLLRQGSSFVPGIVVRKMRGTAHDKTIRFVEISDKGIVVHPDEAVFQEL